MVAAIGAGGRSSRSTPDYPGEVAARYRYLDGGGEIGVIASVTQPFCGDCTRARLSADGRAVHLPVRDAGHDLRGPLRAGAGDEELRGAVGGIWRRPRRPLLRAAHGRRPRGAPKVEMSYIGG